MEEPWLQMHPDFKLNGKSYSLSKLINLAEVLRIEGDTDEKAMARFLLEWLYPNPTVLVTTSGSTGSPKTIALEKTKMIASAKATGAYFNLGPSSTALHCLSSNYIAGKMMLIRALVLGWHLDVVIPNKFPLMQTKAPYDFAAMVPLQVAHSLDELHRISKIIVGGAKMSPALERSLQNVSSEVYATFGMTETITHVAIKKVNATAHSKKQEAFHALKNISFSVDHRNCLVIDAPEISEEKVQTNDVVQLISKTAFKWLGRLDNIINSGGVKIHPERVEEKLAPQIKDAYFIAGEEDAFLGEKVVLVIEGKEKDYPDVDFSVLDKYEVPKAIYFTKTFHYTTTGKIQRKATLETIRNQR